MTLYAGQLVLNLFWRTWPGPFIALVLDFFMLLTLGALLRRNRWAAVAFLPCLTWILFLTLPGIAQWHLP